MWILLFVQNNFYNVVPPSSLPRGSILKDFVFPPFTISRGLADSYDHSWKSSVELLRPSASYFRQKNGGARVVFMMPHSPIRPPRKSSAFDPYPSPTRRLTEPFSNSSPKSAVEGPRASAIAVSSQYGQGPRTSTLASQYGQQPVQTGLSLPRLVSRWEECERKNGYLSAWATCGLSPGNDAGDICAALRAGEDAARAPAGGPDHADASADAGAEHEDQHGIGAPPRPPGIVHDYTTTPPNIVEHAKAALERTSFWTSNNGNGAVGLDLHQCHRVLSPCRVTSDAQWSMSSCQMHSHVGCIVMSDAQSPAGLSQCHFTDAQVLFLTE